MRSVSVALAAFIVTASVLAGCLTPGSVVPDAWREEKDAHGETGLAATMLLRGENLTLAGAADVVVPRGASLALAPAPLFPSDAPLAFFPNVTLRDGRTGLLAIEGDFRASGGAIDGLAADAFHARALGVEMVLRTEPSPVPAPGPFPPEWDAANRSLFFARAATFRAVDVELRSDGARALLVTDAGAEAVPFPVDVARASVLLWSEESTATAERVRAVTRAFTVGGNVTSGEVAPEGRAAIVRPLGVAGHAATLEMDAGSVRADGTFRLTQALTRDGPALAARVEVQLAATTSVTVASGAETWVAVRYREATFVGDAVLANVRVEGAGADMVAVPLERPGGIVETLLDAAGPAAPFVALGVALAGPGFFFLEAARLFGCALATCPEEHPYPAWMPAGDLGTFYVKVSGSEAPGTYPVTIVLEGENFPDVRLPLQVTVAPS